MRPLLQRALSAAGLLAVLAGSVSAATITILNVDGVGEGFNDPTAAAPVGGNPGLTIGEQRLNCFQQAANIWGALLTSSETIVVQAAFNALSCTATSGVLGSCGPRFVEANDPAFEFQGYWYNIALANKQAGVDFVPPGPGENGSDMSAQFNSNLGQPGCVTGRFFYYGFDHNEGPNIDLLAVLLHEFGHGLGFLTVTSGTTGAYLGPPAFPALFDRFLFDETTGLHWDENSAAQRVASAVNTGNLTWDGEEVTYAASTFLSPAPEVVVPFAPGLLEANAASYGPALPGGGLTAEAVVVDDGVAAPLNSDGCETPFVNSVVGKIAVIDRTTCNFTVKSKNAQLNGAVGVILVNNVSGDLAPSGSDPTITIPTVGITQSAGLALKTAISGGFTSVTLQTSASRRAGMHPSGRVRMFAPNPYQGGSSVSHWDVTASPNLQMEPAINSDLTSDLDLTLPNFKDIGWIPHTVSAPAGGPAGRVALASSPNPGRGALTVHMELASEERVELALYDVSGRQVRMLARGTYPAGPHDLAWDGRDNQGRPAAPGVYMARLKGSRTNASHSVILID